jgi:hypothetical protein
MMKDPRDGQNFLKSDLFFCFVVVDATAVAQYSRAAIADRDNGNKPSTPPSQNRNTFFKTRSPWPFRLETSTNSSLQSAPAQSVQFINKKSLTLSQKPGMHAYFCMSGVALESSYVVPAADSSNILRFDRRFDTPLRIHNGFRT